MSTEPSRARPLPGAVLCDPMGILLRLEQPVPRLIGQLAARGVLVDEATAVAGLSALVEEYGAQHLRGVNQQEITEIRRSCADALRAVLPVPLDRERAYQVVMGMLRYELLPGTREALEALRAAGVRIGFASDWDASLPAVLLAFGIADLADVVVSSAQVGEAKPSPAALRTALAGLGLAPADVLVIGLPESDGPVAAALGAPFQPVELGAGIERVVRELLA